MSIWVENMKLEDLDQCQECLSLYLRTKSAENHLCPECSYRLLGHKNCAHEFASSRCIHCYWDGSKTNN